MMDNHGIKTTEDDVLNCLELERSTMTVAEVRPWLAANWSIMEPVKDIPVENGFACTLCTHSVAKLKSMRNHFVNAHPNLAWKKFTKECKIQCPFTGSMKGYIRVESSEDPVVGLSESWRQVFEEEFNNVMDGETASDGVDTSDLRLMSTFIAKIRWDLAVKDVDGKKLVGLSQLPMAKDQLYGIVSCARRYIRECCEKLSGGNMIVRRSLMITRYMIYYAILIISEREQAKFFDALQEKSSQNAYGDLLARLICFYLRLLELEPNEEPEIVQWFTAHPLSRMQCSRLNNLRATMNSDDGDNDMFHRAIEALFCWKEDRKLLNEMACPVQRFLVVSCLTSDGDGFINVRNVTPLIAKLMYCIRATMFMELMRREGEIRLDEGLDGLQVYVKDMMQSPFGFLCETMHLAAAIAGDVSALPQVAWLGRNEFTSLTINGKKVELRQLRRLCQTLMKKAKNQLKREIKMGLPGIKNWNWDSFEPEDDLANISNQYSF
jgi:hypothetical protein